MRCDAFSLDVCWTRARANCRFIASRKRTSISRTTSNDPARILREARVPLSHTFLSALCERPHVTWNGILDGALVRFISADTANE